MLPLRALLCNLRQRLCCTDSYQQVIVTQLRTEQTKYKATLLSATSEQNKPKTRLRCGVGVLGALKWVNGFVNFPHTSFSQHIGPG